MPEKCIWTQNVDGVWETGCGGMFEVSDGLPSENQMRFCPYCGHALAEQLYADDTVGD